MARAANGSRSAFVLVLGVTVLLLVCGARLVALEVHDGSRLRERAQKQQISHIPISAQRGDILDTRGRIFAGSIRRPSIFADPTLVRDVRFAAHTLAPVLGLDPRRLEQDIRDHAHRKFLWVKRLISGEELEAFQRIRRSKGLRGFVVTYEPQRRYLAPSARLASHVIGFVGADQHGLAGIELSYEKHLGGTDGRRTATVDVHKRRIDTRSRDHIAPLDGASVVLTIDVNIQERAELHLKAAVEQYQAEAGTAIVMDPRSGEVLAMANLPDYSPEDPIPDGLSETQRDAARDHLLNRAVSGAYEPGSVFKPFVMSCAIQEGLTKFGERFEINGPIRQFGRRPIRDTHTYGTLLLEEIISKSSNIGMGMLADRCGNERLYEYVTRFGFGKATGITLPNEHSGLLRPLDEWDSYSTQSIPIGQEIAVTPLQLANAFGVFCNGGILYQPRVVRGIVAADGHVIEDRSQPIIVEPHVLTASLARDFRFEALVRTINSGTGRKGAIDGYQVFGKTGTAQIARTDGRGYAPGRYQGTFVCGAPADDPRVVVLVSIFVPRGRSYYGGTVAAPTAAKIMADTLSYLGVPRQTE
ncbi:MAG: penicillin-binding protein 2 [Planctomycetes bacterium]|nr:penicillin-binding protein 2 [Planctomycetota bacterium]